MRIALFSETFPPEINGVATSTGNLHRILNANGHLCVAVTTNPFSKEVIFENNVLRIPGIELKKLYGYRLASLYNSKAFQILKSLQLDVVHIQTEASIGIFGKIVARRLKLPRVYTYHTMYEDYTHYATKGHFDGIAKRIVRMWSSAQAEAATEFISPSQKTKDIMRSYGVERYINVIPTGIDFSKFLKEKQDPSKIDAFKKAHGLDGHFVILSLGRVAKEKSIDFLLRGYQIFLKTAKIPTKMMIVGGGPAQRELEILAVELGIKDHVYFAGPVAPDTVPFYYHCGDLFVSASITETQGLTFMEAMAADKMLLARFDENLVNVIRHNETGFFYRTEDDFAQKLDMILSLSPRVREKMILDSKKLVADFSIEKFYSNIMEVYTRAVRKNW